MIFLHSSIFEMKTDEKKYHSRPFAHHPPSIWRFSTILYILIPCCSFQQISADSHFVEFRDLFLIYHIILHILCYPMVYYLVHWLLNYLREFVFLLFKFHIEIFFSLPVKLLIKGKHICAQTCRSSFPIHSSFCV